MTLFHRSPTTKVLALVGACLLGCGPAATPNDLYAFRFGETSFLAEFPMTDEVYIGLGLSGGGHRASAFGYGVLLELASIKAADPLSEGQSLADSVRFVAGVSGGAVTATWFALRGPDGLGSFRERYLLQDGERYLLNDPFSWSEITRTLQDGVDARDSFGRVLDDELFRGATFSDLDRANPVALRIVASDVAQAAPFIFDDQTFGALCRNLSVVPLSEAVAASAALPPAFRPEVIWADRRFCGPARDLGAFRVSADRQVQAVLRLLAETRARYADPADVASVRLLDGGFTDTLGVSGFVASRAQAALPFAPMGAEQAVRLRHILFLAVDATSDRGRIAETLSPGARTLSLSLYGLNQRLSDDGGGSLDMLLSQRAILATTNDSVETLRAALSEWQRDLISWRCSLAPETVAALHGAQPADWNCRDVTLFVGLVSPDGLPHDLREAVHDVPTRLRLPIETIDLVTDAGRIAARRNPALIGLLRQLQGAP